MTCEKEDMTTATGKHRSGTGSLGRKILALIVAIGTAFGLATVVAPTAAADDRATLGHRCGWAAYKHWVQNCWMYSPAMGQDIQFQIKRSNSNASIYMLDGLRARDDWNAWTYLGHAPGMFAEDDVNVVMPVGGASQFYADWIGPFNGTTTPQNPMWETFLTRELPGHLDTHFGISPSNNALVGLSMGGTAAINLASRHRNQFRQATSLSGYLNTTAPGMYMALQFAMNEGSPGANIWDMWGHPLHPTRFANDPLLNAPRLGGMPVHISAAAGVPGPRDNFLADPLGGIAGIGLEWASRGSTATFELAARASGANVSVSYPTTGVHNWTLWTPELQKARPQILDALNVCHRGGQWTC